MSSIPSELEAVAGRLEAVVRIVGHIIKPAAIAGLLASVLIALALIPWLFHSTGAIVCWALIVGVCLAASLRLFWHRWLLRRTLGSPRYIAEWYASTMAMGRGQAQPLADQLDGVLRADRGSRVRGALRMLASVRTLQALRAMGSGAAAIVRPIGPARLMMTGYAAIVVGVAVVSCLPIMFFSLVGLALR